MMTWRRQLTQRVAVFACGLCTAIALAPLLLVGVTAAGGLLALPGVVAPPLGLAALATFGVALSVLLVTVPVGVFLGARLASASGRAVDGARAFVEVAADVPPVVHGFVVATVLAPAVGPLAYLVAIGSASLPTVILGTDRQLRASAPSLQHAALALGATRFQALRHVLLPASARGLSSAALALIAQAVGDAAALLSIGFLPAAPLPLLILRWGASTEPQALARAWASAALLCMLVLAMELAAHALRPRELAT